MSINILNLTKKYGKKTALNNINLNINEGMFGLLGPNGAGKTTLMRILTTLVKKTDGIITINGINIERKKDIRKIIGYLPQDFSFYPSMNVYETLDYLGVLCNIAPAFKRKSLVIELLNKVNLYEHKKVKIKALSGGMKRRLGIAQALLNNPQVLIVDEPTAGLDPEERVRLRNLLTDFSNKRIVILSTHIVEDIESTCENLAIIKEGNLLFSGKIVDLTEKAKDSVWIANLSIDSLNEIKNKYPVISTVSEGELLKTRLLSQTKPCENAVKINPSIEDAYMKVVKDGEV